MDPRTLMLLHENNLEYIDERMNQFAGYDSVDQEHLRVFLQAGCTMSVSESMLSRFKGTRNESSILYWRLRKYPEAIAFVGKMELAGMRYFEMREMISQSTGLIPLNFEESICLEALTDEFLDKFENTPVVIRSQEHNAWWKKPSGYTGDLSEARVETLQRAFEMAGHCGPEKQIVFQPSSPSPSLLPTSPES